MRNFVDNLLPKTMLVPDDHSTGALSPVADVSFGNARYAAILLIGGDFTSVTDFDITIQSAATAGGSYSAIQTEETTPADLIFEQLEDASAHENAITVGILPLWELTNQFFKITGTVAGSNAQLCCIGLGYDFQDLPPSGQLSNVWEAKIGVLAQARAGT